MTKSNSEQQKIIPYLWFANQAEEAATFYTSLFENSQIGDVTRYSAATAEVSGQAEGSAMTVPFELAGQKFVALNGGPLFEFTPAISFTVSCETEAEIDRLWEKLSAGGAVLMPLASYPFSEKFGWCNDKYGVSWQLNLADLPQKITPSLLFVGEQQGKAEEAVNLYTSLIENSAIHGIERYGEGTQEPAGTVMHAAFSLGGQAFTAMDSSLEHNFTFTEATSFLVNCQTQAEVDELWDRFTAGGEPGQCGWLKDKFGVSWQIVPAALTEMLTDEDPEKAERVTHAMLQMSKIDIEALRQAYND